MDTISFLIIYLLICNWCTMFILANSIKIFNHPEQGKPLMGDDEKPRMYDSEEKAMDDLYSSLADYSEREAYNFEKPEFKKHLDNALNRVKYIDGHFKKQQQIYQQENRIKEEIGKNKNGDVKRLHDDFTANGRNNLDIDNPKDKLRNNNVMFNTKESKRKTKHYEEDYYNARMQHVSAPSKVVPPPTGTQIARHDDDSGTDNRREGNLYEDNGYGANNRNRDSVFSVSVQKRKEFFKTLPFPSNMDKRKREVQEDTNPRNNEINEVDKMFNKVNTNENSPESDENNVNDVVDVKEGAEIRESKFNNFDRSNVLENDAILESKDNEIDTKVVGKISEDNSENILNPISVDDDRNLEKFRKRRKYEDREKNDNILNGINVHVLSEKEVNGDNNDMDNQTALRLNVNSSNGSQKIKCNNFTKFTGNQNTINNNFSQLDNNHSDNEIVTVNYKNLNYYNSTNPKVANSTKYENTQIILKPNAVPVIIAATCQGVNLKITSALVNTTEPAEEMRMLEVKQKVVNQPVQEKITQNRQVTSEGVSESTTFISSSPKAGKSNMTDELKIARQISDFVHNLLTQAADTNNMKKELGLCKSYDKGYTPIKNNNNNVEDEIMKGMVNCMNKILAGTVKAQPCGEMPPELMQFMDWLLLNGVSAREEFKTSMANGGPKEKGFLFSKTDNVTAEQSAKSGNARVYALPGKSSVDSSKSNNTRTSIYRNIKNTILSGLSPYLRSYGKNENDNYNQFYPLPPNHFISHRNIEVPALYNVKKKSVYSENKYNAPLLYPKPYKHYPYDDWMRNSADEDNDQYGNGMYLTRQKDGYSRFNSGRPRLMYSQDGAVAHDNDEPQFETPFSENSDSSVDNLDE